MKKIAIIGIPAALGLGLWYFKNRKSEEVVSEDCSCSSSDGLVKKVIGEQEDSYNLDDLKKYGTKQGVIEVANARPKPRVVLERWRPRVNPKYQQRAKDLRKYGTKHGIIHVANDENPERKKARLARVKLLGADLTGHYLGSKRVELGNKGHQVSKKADFIKSLKKDYKKTQISVRNTTEDYREVILFETNRTPVRNQIAPEQVEDHEISDQLTIPENTGAGIHPQGVVVNPANSYTYVANQLSDNVSVFRADGRIVTLIQLEPSSLSGYNSPVDLAVNTNTNSPNYGTVYVVGSVANTVSVINLNNEVVETIPVGVRPVSIAFNVKNEKVYVSNLVSDTVTVINTETYETETIALASKPSGLGVHEGTGELFVASEKDNSVTVINIDNEIVTTLQSIGIKPVSATYYPATNEMFIASSGTNEVIPIAPAYSVLPAIPVGNTPSVMAYNSNNQFLYVGNRGDDTLTVINREHEVVATISIGTVNNGLAINQETNKLFLTDMMNSQVNLIGYKDQLDGLAMDEDFMLKQQEFQHNPILIKHAKFIFSTDDKFKVLWMRENSVTGQLKATPMSMSAYESPQHFLNALEVDGLKDTIIDGRKGWSFKIAPMQTITIMLYYQQIDRHHLIPTDNVDINTHH